ncbi:hypothetical protein Tco_1120322 [Tanacetum coccineum]
MSHPHPKRNFIPRAVLMKSGFKTLNTARQNFSRVAVSVNTARPINTAYPRPIVNSVRPASNVFNRAHSHVRRPFNKFTTNKNNNFYEKVNTVKGNVTTVGPKVVPIVEKPTVKTNEPKTARKENGVPIIEKWVSDSDEENVPKVKTVEMFNKPSFAKINFVKSTKQVKAPRKTPVDKNRQNTPSPR